MKKSKIAIIGHVDHGRIMCQAIREANPEYHKLTVERGEEALKEIMNPPIPITIPLTPSIFEIEPYTIQEISRPFIPKPHRSKKSKYKRNHR